MERNAYVFDALANLKTVLVQFANCKKLPQGIPILLVGISLNALNRFPPNSKYNALVGNLHDWDHLLSGG